MPEAPTSQAGQGHFEVSIGCDDYWGNTAVFKGATGAGGQF